MERADVVVVGLGAVGGQAALHLARAGARVIGLDRFAPPHAQGSSHGGSRVIREAYYEGSGYVPLVRRAFALWDELGEQLDRPVLRRTGAVHLGRADGEVIPGVRAAAAAWDIPLVEHDRASLAEAAPAFRLPAGMDAVVEAEAGALDVDAAVGGALALARAAGADLRPGVAVRGVHAGGGDGPVRVDTPGGSIEADAVVVAAGAWTGQLVPALAPSLWVERQVMAWFAPPAVAPEAVWFCEHAPGRFVYGFPRDDLGLKVALHHGGPRVDPETVDRAVVPDDVDPLRAVVDGLLAEPLGPLVHAAVCLYTNTADEHFAFGPLPEHPRVVVASACSGHGFKFASAVGEALAHQALGTTPPVDVSAFSLQRLAAL